jgi:hypothetical protein
MTDIAESSDVSAEMIKYEDVPDLLKGNVVQRAVNVSVETNILEPVSHQYTSELGGVTRFVLPAKGVINMPSVALCFEIVNGAAAGEGVDRNLAFQLDCGGTAMIQRITVRCGGQIISRVDECALYNMVKNKFKSQQYRQNVLDVRHTASNNLALKVLRNPAGTAAQAGFTLGTGLVGYHQLINTELDQTNTYGDNILSAANVEHAKQRNKSLRNYDNRGTGPEVAIRLADIIPFFINNQLPAFAMAQLEIECEWHRGPAAATTYANINSAPVCANDPSAGGLAASTGHNISFAAPPFLSIDYLHYDENEQAKIAAAVANNGYRFNFTEVVVTKGINPEYTGGVNGTHIVESNHLLGMMGKEVKKIYVVKNWDLLSAQGQTEKDFTDAGCQTHRNVQLWDLKSANIRQEKYNFIVNNERLYNMDVENPSLQHHYTSHCENNWQVYPAQFDTLNFNADALSILGNTQDAGVVDNTNGPSCFTQRIMGGNAHVIGLNLDKYNEMGNAVGNGTLISTAPIEFRYSCAKIESAVGADVRKAAINLTFFIEHRRSLIITQLGVKVADGQAMV